MKYQSIYLPGADELSRSIRTLALNIEEGLNLVESLWASTKSSETTATISALYTVASVSVPAPPQGYKVLVEGWCNGTWPSGSPLDATFTLSDGYRDIAGADVKNENTSGSFSTTLKYVVSSPNRLQLRLTLLKNADRDTVVLKSRGIMARYVKEG